MTKKARPPKSIDEQLGWLITNTTVLWIERHDTQDVVAGTKVDIDRYFLETYISSQENPPPISFSQVLEPLWQTKFDNMGTQWDVKRQKYRLLYDTMKAFFTSFIGLRLNRDASTMAGDNVEEKLFQGDLAGSHLM